jgi:hypothetical protein
MSTATESPELRTLSFLERCVQNRWVILGISICGVVCDLWEVKDLEEDSSHPIDCSAVLLPTVAILHATETSNTATASHDSDQRDQNHQDQEHDDNETSDDNSITHLELDDANENATDTE